MARSCHFNTCEETSPMADRVASVYKIKKSFAIGKSKVGVVVSRDFKGSKASCALGVQLKFAATSLGWCSVQALSAKFLT